MPLRSTFAVFAFLSLFAAGTALAGRISDDAARAKQDQTHHVDKSPAPAVRRAPIVMGRSVSVRHKSKLHHVKVKPSDALERPTSAEGSNQNE